MATTPKTYSADSADPQFLNQMAQMIAGDMGSNTPFKVTGPQAQTVLDLAKQQNQQDMRGGNVSPADQVAGGFMMGSGAAVGSYPSQQSQQAVSNVVTHPVTSFYDWYAKNAANMGLIVLGIVLGVGALLISQKETIIQVGKSAGKAAELMG